MLVGVKKEWAHEELMALVLKDEPRKPSACKHCGQKGLQWVQYQADGSQKWLLLEVSEGRMKRHECAQAKSYFQKKYG